GLPRSSTMPHSLLRLTTSLSAQRLVTRPSRRHAPRARLGLEELEPRCLLSTYYVSAATGNDRTGNGSPAYPFQTINRAAQCATMAGDVVLVGEGTYRESVQPISDGVTFASIPGESVTVSGTNVVSTPWTLS